MTNYLAKLSVALFTFLLISNCTPKETQMITKEVVTKAPIDESSKPIPVDDRLVQGDLPNGMKYYIQKNQKPENRVELRLALNAGSILEDEDQQGLAHFVEHMAFNGTKNFEKSALVDYLESTGTRFGADLNAYTSFDETVYQLQVRTDSAELFDKGLLVIRDWANGVTFDHEEIDKERGVVDSERRSRLSPDQRMQQIYFPVLFHGSKYANRLPIGKEEIIKNASYETVKRYYKDWYRPDLMAVVVVGDIDVTAVEAQVKEMFGSIPAVENPREREQFSLPHHKETLVSIASDKEASFTRVQLQYKHDKKYTTTQGDFKWSIARGLYNNMLSARFQEITQKPNPPYLFASSGYGGNVGDKDSYSGYAFVPEGKSKLALESLLTENKRVLQHGFTAGELERGKKSVMEGAEKALKEMDKTESGQLASRYVYKYLDKIPTPGPDQNLELYKKYLPKVTLADVNKLASHWIRNESVVVIITGPQKEEAPLPKESEIHELLASVAASPVEAYVDDVVSEPLFSKDLSPVEITSTESYDNVGLEYIELANGIGVYLKKTDFKNDEILMSAFSPGGTSLYSDDDYPNASNASSIVREAGIGAFSPTQLEKLLAGKSVGVGPYIGTYSEGMNGSSSPDDLEILFQLIHKYFTDPKIDGEAYQSYIDKQRGLFKNLLSNPTYFFSNHVRKTMYNNNKRVGWPTDADWDAMNYDRAMEIYKDRFADASDFTFTFVGNFDEAVIKDHIQKYLGDLPNIDREETWKDVGIKAVKGGLKDRIKKGAAQKTNVHMYYHGDYDYNRNNNYVMSSTLAYLRIKLRESLREDLGGVYGVRVSGGGSKKPTEKYGITVSFNADPPMADKLIAAAHAVITTAISDGPSEEDMTKVVETQRQQKIKSLKENRYWQRQISSEHEHEQNFDYILLESLEEKINNLTSSQIQAAIKQYFTADNYIEIIMDPGEEE